ncbi:MAG: hypothetical protein HY730_02820 [Candidatus Tectomicrobia bacterium]|uniref:Uncharacterized protein n=1 Tax=Tectimicrobiota bacterium TaxID=2528274 RepID=A0A933LQG5_UNCTE|nr:hypothetical protein [Candidatus Tectomicrobia bacterium]
MIVGESFQGDTDKELRGVQFELYWNLVVHLFEFPKERFLKSAILLGYDPELVERVKNIKSFDHRIYQYAHDLIATYYRYAYHDLVSENSNRVVYKLPKDFVATGFNFEYQPDRLYPDLVDCKQGSLFDPNRDYLTCQKQNWVHFFHKEALYLTYLENPFAKASIVAALNQNQYLGYEAEDVMAGTLFQRYNCFEWYDKNNFTLGSFLRGTIMRFLSNIQMDGKSISKCLFPNSSNLMGVFMC